MPDSKFLQHHSKFIENVIEHGFVYDICRELLTRAKPQVLNVLRAEVDHAGVDLVLSVGLTMHHIQLKARANKIASDDYDIADAIWAEKSGCVIWVVYDSATMRPKEYYLLGCPLPPLANFRDSTRIAYRRLWTRNANHKRLRIKELTDILFP